MAALFPHLPGLLRVSAQASILIVLVLATQWLCGKRLQPRWRYGLWFLVLLRLIVPWTIPSPTSLFNVVRVPATQQDEQPTVAPLPVIEVPVSSGKREAIPKLPARVSWLVWLWAAGALSLGGCALAGHYRLNRQVRQHRPLIQVPALTLLEDCKALMGVRTPVTLIETEAIPSPTLFGFVRPRLLLPAGFTGNFTNEELRHVFLHELAHIKRWDVATGWAMLALQSIHWFNPLVWVAFRRMRADRELACDALVLSHVQPGENQSYGMTIVKLLERFGQSVRAPSLAGILEERNSVRERISMIATFRNERGLGLAILLFTGLALATLTDAQTSRPEKRPNAQQSSSNTGTPGWSLQEKLDLAEAGNQWAAYALWEAYYRGSHGIKPDSVQAEKWLGELTKDLWVVKFEPIDDFEPTNAGEFLSRINKYSACRSGTTNIGAASFFRTTRQGDKLIGSFLSNYPEELKTSLANVPGVQIISAEQIAPKEFVKYERSPQESLWVLEQKVRQAQAGNQWAAYEVWDAYYRGSHDTQQDPAQADKWLGELIQDVWVVRFKPVDDFAPNTPREFLTRINQHTSCRSGKTNIGAASFFRTTKQGDKLMGSFLSNYPEQLKAGLTNVPGVQFISAERITPEEFIKYEQSQQESL
jgi:beta-lactamase regulating signal transducer with metallopeptidase domain